MHDLMHSSSVEIQSTCFKHSIGQFGVGMKRALFKIGKKFSITSTTLRSRFVLEADVDKWIRIQIMDFRFKSFDEKNYTVSDFGTRIEVTRLNSGVSAQASQQAS